MRSFENLEINLLKPDGIAFILSKPGVNQCMHSGVIGITSNSVESHLALCNC